MCPIMSEEPIYPLCAFMLLNSSLCGEEKHAANYKQTGQLLSLGQSNGVHCMGCTSYGLGGGSRAHPCSIEEPLAVGSHRPRNTPANAEDGQRPRDVPVGWRPWHVVHPASLHPALRKARCPPLCRSSWRRWVPG